jgi:Flp pilus assembly pilin Flp
MPETFDKRPAGVRLVMGEEMVDRLNNLMSDDRAETVVEYALIVGLIALAIILTAGLLGGVIDNPSATNTSR